MTTITMGDYNDTLMLFSIFYGENGCLLCNYLEDPVLQIRTLWSSDNCKSKAVKLVLATILSTAHVEHEEFLNVQDEWVMIEYLRAEYYPRDLDDYNKLLRKAEDVESQLDNCDWDIIEFLNKQEECRVFDTTCWIR